MKKAIIVVPSTMIVNRIEDNNRLLREALAKAFGFDIIVTDNIDVEAIKAYDLVFIDPYKYLNGAAASNTLKMMSLPIKIMAYGADMEDPANIGGKDLKQYRENRNAFFARADKIMCDVYENFKVLCAQVFDQIKSKMVWWPKCVVDYDRYFGLPFNEHPEPKCTLAGKLDDRYALRKYIYKHCKDNIVYYQHPGYKEIDPRRYLIGDAFAKELNKYVCGACPTKVNTRHVLEKHIIIPAAGSLLLTERTADFDRLGMEDGKHYISITRESVVGVINDVVKSPEKYRDIRLAGRAFVRENHTIKNRLAVFGKVLKEMGDE